MSRKKLTAEEMALERAKPRFSREELRQRKAEVKAAGGEWINNTRKLKGYKGNTRNPEKPEIGAFDEASVEKYGYPMGNEEFVKRFVKRTGLSIREAEAFIKLFFIEVGVALGERRCVCLNGGFHVAASRWLRGDMPYRLRGSLPVQLEAFMSFKVKETAKTVAGLIERGAYRPADMIYAGHGLAREFHREGTEREDARNLGRAMFSKMDKEVGKWVPYDDPRWKEMPGFWKGATGGKWTRDPDFLTMLEKYTGRSRHDIINRLEAKTRQDLYRQGIIDEKGKIVKPEYQQESEFVVEQEPEYEDNRTPWQRERMTKMDWEEYHRQEKEYIKQQAKKREQERVAVMSDQERAEHYRKKARQYQDLVRKSELQAERAALRVKELEEQAEKALAGQPAAAREETNEWEEMFGDG